MTSSDAHTAIIDHGGYRVRVHDDAATALKLVELAGDRSVSSAARSRICMELLFCDPQAVAGKVDDLPGLVAKALWEVAYIDVDGSHAKETGAKKVIDWEADAPYIRASLYYAYGKPWDELAREVSYRDICHMVGMLPRETTMGQALYYRTASEPRATKYNQEEVRHFRERKRFWALKGKADAADTMAAQNAQAGDIFASLRHRAVRNG